MSSSIFPSILNFNVIICREVKIADPSAVVRMEYDKLEVFMHAKNSQFFVNFILQR